MKPYHNTTSLNGAELNLAMAKAATQNDNVLIWFRRTQCAWTPDDVQRIWMPDVPLTSVRRAISDLTKAGLLVKLKARQEGRYGADAHLWKAVEQEAGQ